MATRNDDGSVTLKTTGKVAITPKVGDGTGRTLPLQHKTAPVKHTGPRVVADGRAPVKRSSLTKATPAKAAKAARGGGRRGK